MLQDIEFTIRDIKGNEIHIHKGVRFKAIDKLGNEYEYTYLGAKSLRAYDICLSNDTTNTLTYVEIPWFENRKIELI